MDNSSGIEIFLWLFTACIAIWALYWLIKSVFRFLVGTADLGGEAAAIVYGTGTSDTHFLLKVIITILFPPLLFLWIWNALRDGSRQVAAEEQEVKNQEAKELENIKRKNSELWSGKTK